jgi:hypothetical protein
MVRQKVFDGLISLLQKILCEARARFAPPRAPRIIALQRELGMLARVFAIERSKLSPARGGIKSDQQSGLKTF